MALFGGFSSLFSSFFLLPRRTYACKIPILQKKSVQELYFWRWSTVLKVPHDIESSHRLLCKYTNLKDTAGQSAKLTRTPHHSEWSPSLEIICMHFILSCPRTSLRIFDHIHYKKVATKFSENEGGRRPFGIFPKVHSIWRSHPSLGFKYRYSNRLKR